MRIVVWLDVAAFLGFAALVFTYSPFSIHYVLGLALAIAGFILWMLARVQLGESFSVKPKATALVTTGLYSRFRHPIYVFGTMAFCGVFLAWGRWVLFAIYLAVSLLFQYLRVRKEDRVLGDAFGEDYRRYRARTWF